MDDCDVAWKDVVTMSWSLDSAWFAVTVGVCVGVKLVTPQKKWEIKRVSGMLSMALRLLRTAYGTELNNDDN